jgi:pimeloyl-ACP methyl ester carboxylesterase
VQAEQLRAGSVTRLREAVGVAQSSQWQGKAATAFADAAQCLIPEVLVIAGGLENDAVALERYAAQVEHIKADAGALRVRATSLSHDLHRWRVQLAGLPEDYLLIGGPANPVFQQKARLQRRIETAEAAVRHTEASWDELTHRRRMADAACVAALTSAGSRGNLAAATTGSMSGLSGEQLLARIAGLTAIELEVLFGKYPELAGVLASTKDSAAVAAWWVSLAPPGGQFGSDGLPVTSDAQAWMIAMLPAVIGNLNGILYTHRDQANRIVHDRRLEELREIETEAMAILAAGDDYAYQACLMKQGYATGEFWATLDTELAIENTLNSARGLPYQLVQFQPGPPALAAISVGNMDSATQVTVDVPGMGTTVGGSIQEWTASARNMYEEQEKVNNTYGSEGGLAVVAWIGYETPSMPPSPEVLFSDKAEAGAAHLVDFLEGVTGTSGWLPGQNLSVVAHSYGTTTATLAVAQAPVENLTLLASAGLDLSVREVGALQVDPAHVWVSEADSDLVANIGRGSVELGPNRWFGVAGVPSEHPVNPTESYFGARVFSSEDAVVDGQLLHGSGGHDTSPQVKAGLEGTDPSKVGYGYFDQLTTPLYNAALASLGMGDFGLVVTR